MFFLVKKKVNPSENPGYDYAPFSGKLISQFIDREVRLKHIEKYKWINFRLVVDSQTVKVLAYFMYVRFHTFNHNLYPKYM